MKSKSPAIFSFLLFCIFPILCHGESRAEARIPELSLNLIRQNLRPFENVSFEFLTELEDQKTKKWELEGRHRIIVDFSRGFYKLSSVKKNLGSKHCRFVERGWDGKYVIRVEKGMAFTPDLKFVGIRDNINVFATVSSGGFTGFGNFCSILCLYEGRRFDESLYSIVTTPNMQGFIFSQKSKNEITLSSSEGGSELTFSKKDGAMLRRIEWAGRVEDGIFAMEDYKIEKTENKDGWFFPVQVVSTYIDPSEKDKIALRRRTTLVPGTLSINDKLPPDIFTPKIPVRAHLLNNIENTERVVTELDPFLDREGFQKQMDTFVDELRKDLKR